MGGLQVVYLTMDDHDRLRRLMKQLGLNKSDVISVSMQLLEDAMNSVDRARAGIGVNGGYEDA